MSNQCPLPTAYIKTTQEALVFEFKLPDVGEGIQEAEVLRWLVAVGDSVARDQPVVEIQTDKAVMDLPAPVAGRVAAIPVLPGTLARVGDVLIVIATEPAHVEPPTALPPAPTSATNVSSGPRRVLAAPAVRKMALELGIDLAQVAGSGPAGRVLPEDVRRFASQRRIPPEPAPDKQAETMVGEKPLAATAQPALPPAQPAAREAFVEREPLQGLRRRIAERMELAWRVPHVTSFESAEVSKLVMLKRQLQEEARQRSVRLTYTALFIKIATQALKEFPYFNATLDMQQHAILLHRCYHIGVATALPEGLVVPVVRHAERLSVIQIAAEIERLVEQVRQHKLGPAELSGSTFTISNIGSFGGQQGTPIINPPEAAILAYGRIEEQPVVVQGRIEARPMISLALSFDHRLLDGAAAAQFLGRIKALLSAPELLMLDMV